MNLFLKVTGFCLVATTMIACQGGGSSAGGTAAVDMSKLNGTWQATYYKSPTGDVEVKSDDQGFLQMTGSSDGTSVSTPMYMKLFVSFDGSKAKTTIIARDGGLSDEASQDYRIEGNVVVSKTKNTDGTSTESRASVTRLDQNICELKDDKGGIEKFKKVSDADVQSAKAAMPSSGVSGTASSGNGCYSQQNFSCTEKPGLSQGQSFSLVKDLSLVENSPNYYVEGRLVDKADLLEMEGQGYCAISVAIDPSTTDKPYLPNEYRKDGTDLLPKVANPYLLTEISWYVDTVFFLGQTPSGAGVEFVVYCGTVQNRSQSSSQQTSLAAIQKHLVGVISQTR